MQEDKLVRTLTPEEVGQILIQHTGREDTFLMGHGSGPHKLRCSMSTSGRSGLVDVKIYLVQSVNGKAATA